MKRESKFMYFSSLLSSIFSILFFVFFYSINTIWPEQDNNFDNNDVNSGWHGHTRQTRQTRQMRQTRQTRGTKQKRKFVCSSSSFYPVSLSFSSTWLTQAGRNKIPWYWRGNSRATISIVSFLADFGGWSRLVCSIFLTVSVSVCLLQLTWS